MGATAHKAIQRNRPWPMGLAAAAVCLVASTVYLCLSIAQAIQPLAEPLTPTTFVSSKPPQSPDQAGVKPHEPVASNGNVPREAAPSLPAGTIQGAPSESLHAAILDGAGDDADHIAVSVKRLNDGRSASLNGDVQYYAASTFKLAVLYEAALRHSRDEISFDDTLVMSDEDAAEDLGTSGFLEFEDDGSISIRNLLGPMIEVSDNSSAVTLLHAFGSGLVDETLRSLGIPTMTVNRQELWTTADDLARLMEAVYQGEGVHEDDRDFMRDLLLAQSVRSGIPTALADLVDNGDRIGNKTGTWEGAQHDVAFVEAGDRVYIIAILTDGSYEGWQAMHRVAQTVHQALTNGE